MRSRSSRSRMSPRTVFTLLIKPVRTNSHCGTQSRTRQTTSAPDSTRPFTSHPPSKPVAPETNVGRSRQKDTIIHLPSWEHRRVETLVLLGAQAITQASGRDFDVRVSDRLIFGNVTLQAAILREAHGE